MNRQIRLIKLEINRFKNIKWQSKLVKLNSNDNTLWQMTKKL